MSRRRKAREIALQTLYAQEVSGTDWKAAFDDNVERRKPSDEVVEYAERLVTNVMDEKARPRCTDQGPARELGARARFGRRPDDSAHRALGAPPLPRGPDERHHERGDRDRPEVQLGGRGEVRERRARSPRAGGPRELKVFVCSDIHGNVRALQAVLGVYRAQRARRVSLPRRLRGVRGASRRAASICSSICPARVSFSETTTRRSSTGTSAANLNAFAAEAIGWSERMLERNIRRRDAAEIHDAARGGAVLRRSCVPRPPRGMAVHLLAKWTPSRRSARGISRSVSSATRTFPRSIRSGRGERRSSRGRRSASSRATGTSSIRGASASPATAIRGPRAASSTRTREPSPPPVCIRRRRRKRRISFDAGLPRFLGERLLERDLRKGGARVIEPKSEKKALGPVLGARARRGGRLFERGEGRGAHRARRARRGRARARGRRGFRARRAHARRHAAPGSSRSTTVSRACGSSRRRPPEPARSPSCCGDAFALPFADGTFDVVFHQGLLEHFRNPDDLIAENARVLKPGGYHARRRSAALPLLHRDQAPPHRAPPLVRRMGAGILGRRARANAPEAFLFDCLELRRMV